jgi:DNA adenine methylase
MDNTNSIEKLNISPCVKWAGGKRQLLTQLSERMPESFNRYFEPFIGGGALLFSVQPDSAVINDINPQLVNLYRQLQENADAVIDIIKQLDNVECDKEYYLDKRSEYNTKIAGNVLDAECAALMVWINKHCFNGLYRVNGKGLFNVPWNNKTSGVSMDEDNLRGIGKYLSSNDIDIRIGDFADACVDVAAGDFVFIDSPYIPINETANFTTYAKDGFCEEDHKRLAELYKQLDNLGAKVMLTNNNVELIYDLYGNYNIDVVDVRRAINRDASKRKGQEVIITNY